MERLVFSTLFQMTVIALLFRYVVPRVLKTQPNTVLTFNRVWCISRVSRKQKSVCMLQKKKRVWKFLERRGLYCRHLEQEKYSPFSSPLLTPWQGFLISAVLLTKKCSVENIFSWKSTDVYLFQYRKWPGKSGPSPASFIRKRVPSASKQLKTRLWQAKRNLSRAGNGKQVYFKVTVKKIRYTIEHNYGCHG